jgi:DNA-binding CsgD family transcriptional regulator
VWSYSLQDVPVRGRESQELRASFPLRRRQRALVSPGVARSHAGRHLHWDERDVRFTVEEYKVVRLVVLGYTDREIGRELFMSEWTVRYHLRKVFRRLAIRRRVELVGFLLVGPRVSGDDLASQEDLEIRFLLARLVRMPALCPEGRVPLGPLLQVHPDRGERSVPPHSLALRPRQST